ncbi:MAG: SDR family NAD(P)-dependent oxidoreductase, partial [Thiotrichaceae bacterium]|nr:SDR family NAD(P)-dependent oxidoreductase [Thiotrichaceae bacterium]
ISTQGKATPQSLNAIINPLLANREIKKTLDRIERAGGEAEYRSADVTDKQSVQSAVQSLQTRWGAITGIIHGAGVLADNKIEQKTLEEFEAVYQTKVEGLASLLACCQINSLQHLVLFSSAAGFYGNIGQSDYSMANEILNKVAFRFQALHPKAKVLTLNWGPWDGGMVTPALKEMFKKRGVYIIPLDSGAELLLHELVSDRSRSPQVLVGTDMTGGKSEENGEDIPIKKQSVSRFHRSISTANNPFLYDHVIGEHPVFPTVCAIAWMVGAASEQYKEYNYIGLKDFKLFKGIVLNGSHASSYLIETTTRLETEQTRSLEVKISSKNSKGVREFHYSAVLLLRLAEQKAPNITKRYLPTGISQPLSGDTLYQDGTLFHGKTLQGIKNVDHHDEQGLQLTCQIAEDVIFQEGDFNSRKCNIFANDIVYQSLLVWVNKQLGLGSLPSRTKAWHVYSEVKLGAIFYLDLSVVKQSKTSVEANVAVFSDANELIATVEGVEVTLSEHLSTLFKPQSASHSLIEKTND